MYNIYISIYIIHIYIYKIYIYTYIHINVYNCYKYTLRYVVLCLIFVLSVQWQYSKVFFHEHTEYVLESISRVKQIF